MTDMTPSLKNMSNLFAPHVAEVSSSLVWENAWRLDAGTYSAGSISMQNFINASERQIIKLSKIADIYGFGPFKRTYIEASEFGIPLLSSSEIMETDPNPSILAKVDCPKWSQYEVRRGWIMVSCSGTIGNVAIIPKKWDRWGVSQHALRVVPTTDHTGFIYTLLRLPLMKAKIVSMKCGSVIDELYADDLKRLEIPLPNETCITTLGSIINQVLRLREDSDGLLSQANSLIIEINGLPILHESNAAWFDSERKIESVLISSSEVLHNNHSGSEYRLDAHYYNPLAQLAIKNIRQSKSEVKTIDDVTERVFMCNRFKRNYVDEKYGGPFLSGKNIIQIRPTDLKHISLSETTDLDDLKLEAEWTLITRSGTIGRTCFVWKHYEAYAATEHIVRVVPNKEQIDPGYLYAFLSSQYGKQQVLRFTHGSVIDEVTDKQIKKVLIPLPSKIEQKPIGDLVRAAYEKRAEAIRLEDEAQKILMDALTQ